MFTLTVHRLPGNCLAGIEFRMLHRGHPDSEYIVFAENHASIRKLYHNCLEETKEITEEINKDFLFVMRLTEDNCKTNLCVWLYKPFVLQIHTFRSYKHSFVPHLEILINQEVTTN